MGKSTISMAMSKNSYVCLPKGMIPSLVPVQDEVFLGQRATRHHHVRRLKPSLEVTAGVNSAFIMSGYNYIRRFPCLYNVGPPR